MPWRFQTSRERISRAEAHRQSFGERWNALIEEDPYISVLYMDDDGTGTLSVKPVYDSCVMDELSLLLGEILYHLMGALDSCVYQAAIIDSGKNPPPNHDKLYFPICTTPENFHNSAWKIKPLLQKSRAIIERVQPYNAPELAPEYVVFNFNRALGILHEWARLDRHRSLHVVGSWASNPSPKFRFPLNTQLESLSVNDSGIFLEHKYVVATFKLAGYTKGMQVQANPDIAIDVVVNELPPPCADTDTLGNRLRAMIKAVTYVVSEFEESF